MSPLNQKQWMALLEQHGWAQERGGKHSVKMTKPGMRPITLPMHQRQVYSRDLNAAIRRQAGL